MADYTSLGEVGTHAIMRDIIQCKKFQTNYKDLFQGLLKLEMTINF